jgi:hypothetical protein
MNSFNKMSLFFNSAFLTIAMVCNYHKGRFEVLFLTYPDERNF